MGRSVDFGLPWIHFPLRRPVNLVLVIYNTNVTSLSSLADYVKILSEHPVSENVLVICGMIPDANTAPVNPEWGYIRSVKATR